MSSTVEKAEGVVAALEAKRVACVRHGTELQDERANVALDAHTGDQTARKRLDEINAAVATHASELASLDAALRAAGERLAKARQAEASRADQQSARALRAEVKALVACGEEIDRALITLAATSVKMREVLGRIHALGSPSPSFSQLDVIGKNCVLEGLRTSIWNRSFEMLPAPNRHRFTDMAQQWAQMIERNIAGRIGADEEDADAAA